MTSPRKTRVGGLSRRASGRPRRPLRQVAPIVPGCSVHIYETASDRTFFVNADPIKFDGGLNWYAFVSNNPISKTDPSGLQDFIAGFGPMPAPVPPGSYTYNGPTTVGGMAKAVGQSYVQAGQALGSAVKDIATAGGNVQKVELMSAILTPITKGAPLVASTGGLGISVAREGTLLANQGTATVAELALHSTSIVTNGYSVVTAGGSLATDLTDGHVAEKALDLGAAFYTPPGIGGKVAFAALTLNELLALAQPSAETSTGGCRK